VNWAEMIHNRNPWWTFVNIVMNYHKSREYLDQVNNYQQFKENPVLNEMKGRYLQQHKK
jgi:hypothetical protein